MLCSLSHALNQGVGCRLGSPSSC